MVSSAVRSIVGLLAAVLPLATTSVWAAAPDKVPAQPVADTDPPINLVAGPTEDGIHVHQRVDGNVAGRIFYFDDLGAAHPTRAQINVVEHGQIVASVRADEWGRFQVVGLRPGTYSLLVASPHGAAAAAIRVIPFEVNALNNPSLLNISVIPPSELNLLNDMLRQVEPAGAATPPAAPPNPAAGAAGGGGGGLGGLLGAAGMGLGVSGLSGGGAGGAGGAGPPGQASQFIPNPLTNTALGGTTPTSSENTAITVTTAP